MERIRLADAIANLRAELTEARNVAEARNAGDQEIQLVVGDITVELQLQVEHSVKAKGGVQWFVFKAEGEGAAARHATHKLILGLTATDKGGRKVLVSNRRKKAPG